MTYRGKNLLFNFPMYKSLSKNLLIFCSSSFLNFLIRMRKSYFYYFSYLRENVFEPVNWKRRVNSSLEFTNIFNVITSFKNSPFYNTALICYVSSF